MYTMTVNTFSNWLISMIGHKGWTQAERAQFEITFEEAQELLDVLPEWMLDDEPKIVNGLLARLFRCIRVMPDGEIIPVLRK